MSGFNKVEIEVSVGPPSGGGGVVDRGQIESIVMDTLIALGVAPVLLDADGSVLTDGIGNILVTE